MAWTFEITSDELKNFPQTASLDSLIEVAEERARENGFVVCAVEVNGLKLSEADEQKFASTGISEIHHFRAHGLDQQQIVGDTITSLLQLLPLYEKAALDLSVALRQGNLTNELITHFAYFVGDIQLFNDSVLRLHNFGLGVPSEWERAFAQLSSSVRQILESFEKRDTVLLADLLEYELTRCFNDWQDVLRHSVEKTGEENPMVGSNEAPLAECTSAAGGNG